MHLAPAPKTPKKKILFLDGAYDWSLPHSTRTKLRLDTVDCKTIDKDPYVRPPAVCKRIAMRANNAHFDLIIIGNCGNGIDIVRALNEAARRKTVIAYHWAPPRNRDDYEALGVRMFSDRKSLADALPEFLLRAAEE